ncbi:MAG: helix-hairpin-helix domain-containing protein [Lautropia sp.]|nr:helix-hairpin-helix domain-containing protein [Lautropia sp.]
MNPAKADRTHVEQLTDLPNVGAAAAADLRQVGIHHPVDLVGQCPFCLYDRLCASTGKMHDPCVIDVFMSITRFMAGAPAQPWWKFTDVRKQVMHGVPAASPCPAGQVCPGCIRRYRPLTTPLAAEHHTTAVGRHTRSRQPL